MIYSNEEVKKLKLKKRKQDTISTSEGNPPITPIIPTKKNKGEEEEVKESEVVPAIVDEVTDDLEEDWGEPPKMEVDEDIPSYEEFYHEWKNTRENVAETIMPVLQKAVAEIQPVPVLQAQIKLVELKGNSRNTSWYVRITISQLLAIL